MRSRQAPPPPSKTRGPIARTGPAPSVSDATQIANRFSSHRRGVRGKHAAEVTFGSAPCREKGPASAAPVRGSTPTRRARSPARSLASRAGPRPLRGPRSVRTRQQWGPPWPRDAAGRGCPGPSAHVPAAPAPPPAPSAAAMLLRTPASASPRAPAGGRGRGRRAGMGTRQARRVRSLVLLLRGEKTTNYRNMAAASPPPQCTPGGWRPEGAARRGV